MIFKANFTRLWKYESNQSENKVPKFPEFKESFEKKFQLQKPNFRKSWKLPCGNTLQQCQMHITARL